MAGRDTPVLVPINSLLFRGFSWVARRRIRGSFSALRIAHLDRFPKGEGGPLIVYLNHPSWWDPLTCIVLAPHLIGNRSFYAPIEAKSLQRYGIFRRLGLFPVEIDSPRGAAQFLRSAETVLREGHVLGLTPQGRFADPRERPAGIKPGLGALLARMQRSSQSCTVVPLALEYSYWDAPTPEVLACIGRPLARDATVHSAKDWTVLLEAALVATQDELGALAKQREQRNFETVLQGSKGLSGFYGLWQKFTVHLRKDNT